MKFSNRLLLFLARRLFCLFRTAIYKPSSQSCCLRLVDFIQFTGFLLQQLFLGYFSAPKELRSPVYLFKGFVSLLLALHLVAYGFVTLPVVIPTIVEILVSSRSHWPSFALKAIVWIDFPIIDRNITWVTPLWYTRSGDSVPNPVAGVSFVVIFYLYRFQLLKTSPIIDAFRNSLVAISIIQKLNHILSFFVSSIITTFAFHSPQNCSKYSSKSDGIVLQRSISCNNNRSRTGGIGSIATENKKSRCYLQKESLDSFCDFNKKKALFCSDHKKLNK